METSQQAHRQFTLEDECEIRHLVEARIFSDGPVDRNDAALMVSEYYRSHHRMAMPMSRTNSIINAMLSEGILSQKYSEGCHYLQHTPRGMASFTAIGLTI